MQLKNEADRKKKRLAQLNKTRMDAKYNEYLNQVSSLNEKKSYLNEYRETLPFDEKKRLIFEITQA